MNMSNCIILGKGPSITRGTCDYISGFDTIVIVNCPVWEGYEKHLPKKAKIQFRNNGTRNFTKNEIEELGLKTVISTTILNEKLPYEATHGIADLVYPDWETDGQHLLLRVGKDSFSASGGVLALDYMLKNYSFEKIALIGLDLIMQNKRMYYFEPDELQENLKYLFDNGSYESVKVICYPMCKK